MKKFILLLLSFSLFSNLFSQDNKGLNLGFHITPGLGTIQTVNSKYDFGINAGADLCINFNNKFGFKTGVSYLNLPIKYFDNSYEVLKDVTGNISSVGIPIKFIFTTGNKIGFYLESGLNIYFPVSSKYSDTIYHYNLHQSIVLAEETALGLNIKTSETMSLNFGLLYHFSLTKFFPNETTKGIFVGLQMGMLIKLKK
jgi:hypothetical protein